MGPYACGAAMLVGPLCLWAPMLVGPYAFGAPMHVRPQTSTHCAHANDNHELDFRSNANINGVYSVSATDTFPIRECIQLERLFVYSCMGEQIGR